MVRNVVLAAAMLVAASAAAQAATLDFRFSFTNSIVNGGGGIVTGIIRGLADNATGAASSVEVTGNPRGFGLGEYVGNPSNNTFTVTDGKMTAAIFLSFGNGNRAPAVTTSSLFLSFGGNSGLTESFGAVSTSRGGLEFQLLQPTPIPLPAGLPLLLAGIGAFAAVRARKAREAMAA